MVWLPFGKSSQVEQRSHTPLGVVPQGAAGVPPGESDIAHTLNQITQDGTAHVRELNAEGIKATNELVAAFVELRPLKTFIIDGEKYANESIICTSDERGNKTCLKLKYNLIELFKQMQRLEYFCSLPNDIDATYFECRKIA